jgi:hypothetical protein
MDPFVESLRQERTRLQAEVAARQQRLKLIDELLASYTVPTSPTPTSPTPASPPLPLHTPASERPQLPAKTNGHARPESKAAKVRRMTAELLTREGRTHRNTILDHLKSAGVMGNEKNPIGQLASYLSANNDLFAADGNGNFTLRQG